MSSFRLEVSYVYDVLGQRISSTTDGQTVHFTYTFDNTWADFSATGQVIARYLFGNGADEIVAHWEPVGTSWHLSDHLGSVRDLLDATGRLTNHIDYDGFGGIISQTTGTEERFLFTGREFDSATGLYYYRARYFSPGIGRFTQQDPVGRTAGDTNLYRYVGNSPINATDPSGQTTVERAVLEKIKAAVIRSLAITQAAFYRAASTPLGLAIFARFQTVSAWLRKFATSFNSAISHFGTQLQSISSKAVNGVNYPTFQSQLRGGLPAAQNFAQSIVGKLSQIGPDRFIGENSRFWLILRPDKGGTMTVQVLDKVQKTVEAIRFQPHL
jgi:RHS repeat-associated protein